MAIRIQNKRDTAANWTSNDPVLLAAEIGIETDTLKFKIGDGTTAWTALGYATIPVDQIDEAAQDAVGGILADSNTIDFTYTDETPEITADLRIDVATPGTVALTTSADGLQADVDGVLDCGSSTI